MKKIFKIGLVPRLIIAIISGITLGVAMVAAPGTPGRAVMSALPFLGIVGISAGSF